MRQVAWVWIGKGLPDSPSLYFLKPSHFCRKEDYLLVSLLIGHVSFRKKNGLFEEVNVKLIQM